MGELTGIRMPKLSDFDEYKILRFHRKVGDRVKRGEIFLDILTDEGFERSVGFYLSGTITEITVAEGDYVREDYLLGVMDEER
jgi:pyruvate/2-oxoglutarate dehydrogenase complex dihydrolipoamide acyltransferase (E2) component